MAAVFAQINAHDGAQDQEFARDSVFLSDDDDVDSLEDSGEPSRGPSSRSLTQSASSINEIEIPIPSGFTRNYLSKSKSF